MMTKIWDDLLRRVQSWPTDAQQELIEVALEIEAELNQGRYRATPEELRGIDRGLNDARAGKFATEQDVADTFAKYRQKCRSNSRRPLCPT